MHGNHLPSLPHPRAAEPIKEIRVHKPQLSLAVMKVTISNSMWEAHALMVYKSQTQIQYAHYRLPHGLSVRRDEGGGGSYTSSGINEAGPEKIWMHPEKIWLKNNVFFIFMV